ncbi:MAG: four helix bundle protein [Dehalococcoidia bacterium]|nr:four helix bundle protein [Dehalococcoidia bacterium]
MDEKMQSSNQASMQSSNQPYNYQRLDVWQKAQEVAAAVIRMARALPRDPASVTLARQLVAAAGSVGANVAEGHGRYTFAAYRNHLSIARGSACEAGSWLDLLTRTEYINPSHNDSLQKELSSIVAILTSKMRDLDNRAAAQKRPAVREATAGYGPESFPDHDDLFD